MSGLVVWMRKWFETSSQKQKVTAFLLFLSLLATGVYLTVGGASEATSDPLELTPFYYVSAFVKLIAVLLLIVGISVIYRRWQQLGSNGKLPRQMRLLETIRLSPKQALHLIVVGDQKLLIGATDQNVSLITQVEDDMDPVPAEETPAQTGLDFGSLMQTLNLNLPSENIKGKE
jgi:flagellar biosynthetic protein FliO